MSIAKHRDPSYIKTEVAIQAQQVTDGNTVNGASINLQDLDMPQAAKFQISFNSADNNDDFDFKAEKSPDDSSWSDISGATASGLSGDNADAEIEVRNLQSHDQYIRLSVDGSNTTLNGANAELAATATFVGAKEV